MQSTSTRFKSFHLNSNRVLLVQLSLQTLLDPSMQLVRDPDGEGGGKGGWGVGGRGGREAPAVET